MDADKPPANPLDRHFLKMYVGDAYANVKSLREVIARKRVLEGNRLPEINQVDSLEALLPGCARIGKSPNSKYAYFSFATEADYLGGKAFLSSISKKGVQWVEVMVEERDRAFFERPTGSKRAAPSRNEESAPAVSSVSPWEGIAYEQQLKRKRRHCVHILNSIAKQSGGEAMACPFESIAPSPKAEGYRNRVDYTVGLLSKEDTRPCLGFNSGAFKDGHRGLQSYEPCKITPEPLIGLAGRIEGWIQKWAGRHSLTAYDKATHTGFWRRVSLRITGEDRIMFALQTTSPEELFRATRSESRSESPSLEELRGVLSELEKDLRVEFESLCASIQWQLYDGASNAAPFDLPFKPLHGPLTVSDYVCGKKFSIGANSFFQVNTPAMEILISKIQTLPCIHEGTVLLDICSGTGLIGLAMCDSVRHVIGVEMVAAAVRDAEENARGMSATNVEYICGKVEDSCEAIQNRVAEIISEQAQPKAEIVAIVDPPRSGLHKDVVKWLRRTSAIQHIVYISCEQSALVRDAVHLFKAPSLAYPGNAFRPVKSFAVDMFPQTPHVEQVLVMER